MPRRGAGLRGRCSGAGGIHSGAIRCVARDTRKSGARAQILNERPYAFIDDATLRGAADAGGSTHAAQASTTARDLGALTKPRLSASVDEARTIHATPDELHARPQRRAPDVGDARFRRRRMFAASSTRGAHVIHNCKIYNCGWPQTLAGAA